MRIVLLGSAGQVGWELQRSLAVLVEIIALGRQSTPHAADFSDPDSVARTARALRPGVIVNAAAHTAICSSRRKISACTTC